MQSQELYEVALALVAGLGLAAACGFRVFVPLLVVSIAVHADAVHVAPAFAWIGSTPALIAFAAATVLEILGYYIPGVDHFLDVVATPSAAVAGALLSTAFITDMDPWMRWSMAAMVGGGIAGTVQLATVATRAISGFTTFGLGNPIVATGELVGSTTVAIAAVVAPLVAILVLLFAVAWMVRRWLKKREAREAQAAFAAAV
jgi:hypothetical protein